MINKKCKKEIYYAGGGDVREMLMMDHKQKCKAKHEKVYGKVYIYMYIMCTRTTRGTKYCVPQKPSIILSERGKRRIWERVLEPRIPGTPEPRSQTETESGVLGN